MIAHHIGELSYQRAAFEEAAGHFSQSLELARDADQQVLVGKALSNLGLCKLHLGQWLKLAYS